MKNYLVIGASSGIGKELATLLSQNNHQVYGTYHENIMEDTQNISYHSLNVEEDTWNLDFLPDTLDGLVYCPGSINLKPFKTIKPKDFTKDFNLQVVGAVRVIQAVLSKLKKQKGSSIVLFSTVAVQVGFNFHAQVSTSKGAIEGLTRALAAEFAPNIRVNAIAPSLTDTPLAAKLLNTEDKRKANAQRHPLRTLGEAQNIAEVAAFLLSEKSKWMTGQILHIDGGISNIKV